MKATAGLAALGMAVLAGAAQAEAASVRNVLFILLDDQGAGFSGIGSPGVATPWAEQLARQGAYFSRAYASCGSCAPSRASILTGMWPHSNGHWRNTVTPTLRDPDVEFSRQSSKLDRVGIGDDVPTLVEILRAHGFHTAITHKFHLSPPWRYPFETRDPVQHNPAQFKAAIARMIRQSGDRPFFILANIEPPHRSFRNTAYFKDLFVDGRLQSPDIRKIGIPAYLPDLPEVRQDLQEYYASVQVADECTGAILEALRDSGRMEETLIVYTSDNGMSMYRAKASAYPGGTHVPLAVAGPGVEGGRLCEQAVSLVDLMPTLLDALGLPVPPNVQGESLWKWLSGTGPLPSRRWVFAEHNSHGPNPAEAFPQRAATDGRWYYILNLDPSKPQLLPDDLTGAGPWRNPGYPAVLGSRERFPQAFRLLDDMLVGNRPGEELYDLKNDPWAMRNLAANLEYRNVLEALRTAVEAWRDETGDIGKSVSEFARREEPRGTGGRK